MRCIVVHLGEKDKDGNWVEPPVEKLYKTQFLVDDFAFDSDDKKLAMFLRESVLALEKFKSARGEKVAKQSNSQAFFRKKFLLK